MALMSHLRSLMPHLCSLMPRLCSLMPHLRNLMPRLHSLMPRLHSLMPHSRSLMPHLHSLMPHLRSLIFGYRTTASNISNQLKIDSLFYMHLHWIHIHCYASHSSPSCTDHWKVICPYLNPVPFSPSPQDKTPTFADNLKKLMDMGFPVCSFHLYHMCACLHVMCE